MIETDIDLGLSAYARALVDLRDRVIQKARIQFSNRLSAMERAADTSAYYDTVTRWHDRFQQLEKELDADIASVADDLPIVARMTAVKGIGKTLAVKVAVMIDIRRADTVSALWRYAGYGVAQDGQRDRLQPGVKSPYNTRLKTTCYLVGTSFLRLNSPYRRIYDETRAYYERERPDWTKAHRHQAAMRKMIKVWLSHLWVVWRELEGLPVSDPYVIAAGAAGDGPHRMMTPEEFGW